MTAFDEELIAALAEGRLPPDEAAAAEARIAADPAASAELDAQRIALAALAAATPPMLDDLERRRLRASVAAQLDVVLPAAAPSRRRFTFNWAAIATAAAVLVGVVLVAPLLSLLNTSGGDDTLSQAQAPTTQEAGESDLLFSANEPAAADEGEAESAATTVVADALSAAEAPTAEDRTLITAFAAQPLPELGELTEEALVALSAARFQDDGLAETEETDKVDVEALPCGERLAEDFASTGFDIATDPVTLAGTGTRDGERVLAFVLGGPDAAQAVVLRSPVTCDLVATIPAR